MNKREFAEALKRRLEEKIEKDSEISIVDVKKNNDIVMTGLSFRREGSNVSPTIYVEPFYELYIKGTDMEFLVERIIYHYNESKVLKTIDLGFLGKWDCVRDQIVVKLINYEMNKEMLQDVPHKKFLDLAIVF